MNAVEAIFLGLVQGVAEFLPISGSGHLVLFQNFFGIGDWGQMENLLFGALLRLGTVISVILVYWQDIRTIGTTMGIGKPGKDRKSERMGRRLLLLLLIGTLPLAADAVFHQLIAGLYRNTLLVGAAFLLSGSVLILSGRTGHGNKDVKNTTLGDALLIGAAQAISAVPGLSRTGLTVCAGIGRGMDREFAMKFSFLLSVPAALCGNIVLIIYGVKIGVDWSFLPFGLLGMAIAAVAGCFVHRLLKSLIQRGTFGNFCYYCWGAGLVTLLLSLIK